MKKPTKFTFTHIRPHPDEVTDEALDRMAAFLVRIGRKAQEVERAAQANAVNSVNSTSDSSATSRGEQANAVKDEL